MFSFIVLNRRICFPLTKNVLFVSRYSGYSLYNNSSTSAKVELPEQGIEKHILWSLDRKVTDLSPPWFILFDWLFILELALLTLIFCNFAFNSFNSLFFWIILFSNSFILFIYWLFSVCNLFSKSFILPFNCSIIFFDLFNSPFNSFISVFSAFWFWSISTFLKASKWSCFYLENNNKKKYSLKKYIIQNYTFLKIKTNYIYTL